MVGIAALMLRPVFGTRIQSRQTEVLQVATPRRYGGGKQIHGIVLHSKLGYLHMMRQEETE